MIAIKTIQTHGRLIAVDNGHDMSPYKRTVVESMHGIRYISSCNQCKRRATVYWNEHFSTLGISGGALLRKCRKRRK